MNRNGLYALLGALVVLVIVMGVYIYDREKEPEGVELKIGENGISVQEK
ncbi:MULTISPECIES: hypothetical protein [unclassified Rhizobium]|nr:MULTISPECIES: hypothetical protein [unclassified Rhizobium]TCM58998.1 hypothetical protein C8J36_101910 [Rhizobium sp. PP-F2F-G48]